MSSRLIAALAAAAAFALTTPILAAPPQPARPAPKTRQPPLTTFMPSGPLEQFVVAQFDIRTINSSMSVGRELYQARLLELGYRPLPRRRDDDPLVLQSASGMITLSLFERGDHNSDGIEDVLICLNDRAKAGFNATQPLVLQKYSDSTPLVALAVGVDDPRCPRHG